MKSRLHRNNYVQSQSTISVNLYQSFRRTYDVTGANCNHPFIHVKVLSIISQHDISLGDISILYHGRLFLKPFLLQLVWKQFWYLCRHWFVFPWNTISAKLFSVTSLFIFFPCCHWLFIISANVLFFTPAPHLVSPAVCHSVITPPCYSSVLAVFALWALSVQLCVLVTSVWQVWICFEPYLLSTCCLHSGSHQQPNLRNYCSHKIKQIAYLNPGESKYTTKYNVYKKVDFAWYECNAAFIIVYCKTARWEYNV